MISDNQDEFRNKQNSKNEIIENINKIMIMREKIMIIKKKKNISNIKN